MTNQARMMIKLIGRQKSLANWEDRAKKSIQTAKIPYWMYLQALTIPLRVSSTHIYKY